MHSAERDTIREHLERFRAVTLQCLDRTPPDRLAWSPTDGLMTFAGQYAHIASVERLYRSGLSGQGWEPASNVLHGPESIDLLRNELVQTRAGTLAWLDTVAGESLDEPVHVPWLPVKWTLRSWLWYLVEHELHHKGQLALYLHLCGIEAPFFAFPLPSGVRPDKRPFVPPSPAQAAS